MSRGASTYIMSSVKIIRGSDKINRGSLPHIGGRAKII
jgi:hypothetical protein